MNDPTAIAALFSLIGTLVGTFGGILTGSRLTNYRLAQLEEKVGKHNNLIERTYKIEESIAIQGTQLEAFKDRVANLEEANEKKQTSE